VPGLLLNLQVSLTGVKIAAIKVIHVAAPSVRIRSATSTCYHAIFVSLIQKNSLITVAHFVLALGVREMFV